MTQAATKVRCRVKERSFPGGKCTMTYRAADGRCCGWILTKVKVNSLARTAAFSLAALIFYVPANVYPILRMEYYGAYSESTVWDGGVKLFPTAQWLGGAIVFFASSLVPPFQ